MTRRLELIFFFLIVISLSNSASGQNISDEARRHFDRGMTAVEMAKSAEDFEIAITEFKQATTLAPDWADAYFNLAKVQEAAEKYTESIANLRQYLRLSPNASDAGQVASLINKIEYKAENVITVAKAVSVLGRLYFWQSPFSSGTNANIRPHGPDSIEVPTSVLWTEGRKEPDVFRRTVKVTGPRLAFQYTVALMDKKGTANYTVTYDVEIEVVSLTKATVKESALWTYWAAGGETVNRINTYELVPANTNVDTIEPFDRNIGWPEFKHSEASAVIADGKYTFENKKQGYTWNVHKDILIDTTKDFSIEAGMRFVNGDVGNFYGILWGRKDGNNFYFFGVTANGNYAYRKWLNGAWSEVISYKPSSYILTGTNVNKLTIRKRGARSEFYINDKLVDSAPFENFSGSIGFHLNHVMKVEVDYLRVSYP